MPKKSPVVQGDILQFLYDGARIEMLTLGEVLEAGTYSKNKNVNMQNSNNIEPLLLLGSS